MRLGGDTIRKTVRLAAERHGNRSTGNSKADGTTLEAWLRGLTHQELTELMAVMSVGRGDPGSDRFQTLVDNIHLTAGRIVEYLMDKPHLAGDLEKGMRKLGLKIENE